MQVELHNLFGQFFNKSRTGPGRTWRTSMRSCRSSYKICYCSFYEIMQVELQNLLLLFSWDHSGQVTKSVNVVINKSRTGPERTWRTSMRSCRPSYKICDGSFNKRRTCPGRTCPGRTWRTSMRSCRSSYKICYCSFYEIMQVELQNLLLYTVILLHMKIFSMQFFTTTKTIIVHVREEYE